MGNASNKFQHALIFPVLEYLVNFAAIAFAPPSNEEIGTQEVFRQQVRFLWPGNLSDTSHRRRMSNNDVAYCRSHADVTGNFTVNAIYDLCRLTTSGAIAVSEEDIPYNLTSSCHRELTLNAFGILYDSTDT